MKRNTHVLVLAAVGILIAPQIAFAAWWNPFSWSVWNIFKPAPKAQLVEVVTTVPAVPETTTPEKVEPNTKPDTTTDSKDALIDSLQKQVANLSQKVTQPKAVQPSEPIKETPKTSVITLPNGSIVELDASGNIIRTIKEALQNIASPAAPSQAGVTTLSISKRQV